MQDKNEVKVLRAVFAGDPVTRTTIARQARLSLVKVSSVLSGLTRKGYLRRSGKTRTRGGRPSFLYGLQPGLGCTVGVSVALESLQLVTLDAAKAVVARREYPLELPTSPDEHVASLVDQLSSALGETIAALPGGRPPLAIGLALPGMVDSARGVWLLGLQLTGVTHIQIARQFSEGFGVPVFIEDEARSLAFLAMHTSEARRARNFVLVYLGLGLGTGVVINRRLYCGHHGLAGEIGHVEQPGNSYRCSCGSVGCLETLLSTGGILRLFRDRLQEGVISVLQRHSLEGAAPLSLEAILAAARSGDRLALATLGEIGGSLGEACSILIKLFNPERLIISGAGSLFGEFWAEPLQQLISQRVLPEMLAGFRTLFAAYEPHHEAQGAALLAMDQYLGARLRQLARGGTQS